MRKPCRVDGGKILVFGDIHLDPNYVGMHRSYIQTCYEVMDSILGYAKEEKAGAIIFTGDVMGVNTKSINDKQFLMRVMQFFSKLNVLTNGNVFAVKGNHDMGDFTDYDFLLGINHFRNPEYVDYYGDNGIEIRFHLVNYGDEKNKLKISKDASNVVLGHNDYYVDGASGWYSPYKTRVELKTLSNFSGVSLVISGHIHMPSDSVMYTELPDGESIGLFYLGNPTRVAERIPFCWYAVFEYSVENGSSGYECRQFELKPIDEEFYPKEDFERELSEEEEKEERRQDVLSEVINEVMASRLAVGNLFEQIDRFPASNEAKKIAKKYLESVMED